MCIISDAGHGHNKRVLVSIGAQKKGRIAAALSCFSLSRHGIVSVHVKPVVAAVGTINVACLVAPIGVHDPLQVTLAAGVTAVSV